MPSVETQGAQIWFEERGQGPLVLLVHGGLFDPMHGARFWSVPGVLDDLVAAGYRVLTPDRRYSTGRTTSDFGAHTWDIEAADLTAVLRAAGGTTAHVVAGTNGCSAAIRLALTRPELLRSLTLCWPAAPRNAALAAQFARAATYIEGAGPAAYLAGLRAHGLPRPGDERPGFAFGAALLHDVRLAASFVAQPAAQAARSVRATAAALLPGDVLRGVWRADTAQLAACGLPLMIVPTEPEDLHHTRAAAQALIAVLPGARVAAGTPVAPSPSFAKERSVFAASMRLTLHAVDARD